MAITTIIIIIITIIIPTGIYWVPDLLCFAFYIHYPIMSLQQNLEGATIIIPISQIRKLRLR